MTCAGTSTSGQDAPFSAVPCGSGRGVRSTQFDLSDRRPMPFACRHNTRDHIALFGEYPPHPIDDGTHAGGAAYVAMNDHPVRGGEVGDWRGQPFEEGMAVAD